MARRRLRGFTLIELLVAIGIMALMAGLSWRGLDGMARTQTQLQQRADTLLTLQAGLSQWTADLDALVQLPKTPALDWDGRALRITRRSTVSAGDGLLVVAWTRRSVDGVGQWLRWQSAPLLSRGALQTAWAKAAQWAQNPGEDDKKYEVRVVALDQWAVFYYRADAWTNPLSSDAAPPPSVGEKSVGTDLALPDGVRLVLTLPAGAALGETLTRDWVRLSLGGGKS
jgi:general secretion pathway protein J